MHRQPPHKENSQRTCILLLLLNSLLSATLVAELPVWSIPSRLTKNTVQSVHSIVTETDGYGVWLTCWVDGNFSLYCSMGIPNSKNSTTTLITWNEPQFIYPNVLCARLHHNRYNTWMIWTHLVNNTLSTFTSDPQQSSNWIGPVNLGTFNSVPCFTDDGPIASLGSQLWLSAFPRLLTCYWSMSEDGGKSWNSVTPLSSWGLVYNLRLISDQNSTVSAFWLNGDDSVTSTAAFFCYSTWKSDNRSWSDPGCIQVRTTFKNSQNLRNIVATYAPTIGWVVLIQGRTVNDADGLWLWVRTNISTNGTSNGWDVTKSVDLSLLSNGSVFHSIQLSSGKDGVVAMWVQQDDEEQKLMFGTSSDGRSWKISSAFNFNFTNGMSQNTAITTFSDIGSNFESAYVFVFHSPTNPAQGFDPLSIYYSTFGNITQNNECSPSTYRSLFTCAGDTWTSVDVVVTQDTGINSLDNLTVVIESDLVVQSTNLSVIGSLVNVGHNVLIGDFSSLSIETSLLKVLGNLTLSSQGTLLFSPTSTAPLIVTSGCFDVAGDIFVNISNLPSNTSSIVLARYTCYSGNFSVTLTGNNDPCHTAQVNPTKSELRILFLTTACTRVAYQAEIPVWVIGVIVALAAIAIIIGVVMAFRRIAMREKHIKTLHKRKGSIAAAGAIG